MRYPHLDVVVELDAKSGTTVGLVPSPKFFDVVVELDAKSCTTVGSAPPPKINSGGRE